MATNSTAEQTHDKINKLINSSRFNESFLMLKNQITQNDSLKQYLEKLKSVEMNYRYMLDFLAEGNNDPSRNEMVDQIRENLFLANDILLRNSKIIDSPDIYSSTRRMEALRRNTFSAKLANFISSYEADNAEGAGISESQAKALEEIFNYVWTLGFDNVSEYEEISESLDNPELPDYLKASIISALTLGSISFFVPETFEILLNQFENSESIPVKARSIVGIFLLALLHPKRVAGNIDLRSRLILSSKEENNGKMIENVLLGIIKTFDTQRIDNKMRTEVIPELMKMQPEIIDKMKNMASDAENFLSDSNPNWEEMLENSSIGDKLKEINDLQMEGADVMVTAFSNLKNFPFFNSVSNWFLPFSPDFYLFKDFQMENDSEFADRLTTVMCDSDLHSFLLSINSMPKERKDQMFANMKMQMKEAHEALSSAVGETDESRLNKKVRHALQDLYRFFKFFRKKADFKDPFSQPFTSAQINPIAPLFDINDDVLRVLAEFYFKNKYFAEAADIFENLQSHNPDLQIWEKIGFCYDRLKIFDKAAEWYYKAELVNPENPWLIKKLAIALKNAGRHKEALEFYEKALVNEPDNYHLLMSAAQCLLETENFDQARQHLYHAQYLKPEKREPLRALAWTELLARNLDKAKLHYEKILDSDKADKTDFLNAAHGAMAAGDFKNAIKNYRKFIDLSNPADSTALVVALRDDAKALNKLGVKNSDLRIIVDKIRYDLYSKGL